MATIGLDRLYYAKITENDAGEETYGTPSQLAKAISADLSVELAEATLYADDGASEIVKEYAAPHDQGYQGDRRSLRRSGEPRREADEVREL